MTLDHDTGLSRIIIGLAMRVHTSLGPGLLESAYKRCLCLELERNDIPHLRQVDIRFTYEGIQMDTGYRADIIVADEILLEIKAVEQLVPLHEAQLLT